MNVVIPMAGAGKRFSDQGYREPKPFIQFNNKPMIQNVIENLNINANHIFIIQESSSYKDKLDDLLSNMNINCTILSVDKLTDGPACTALLAREIIDSNPLLIVNCDQMIHDFDIKKLEEFVEVNNADGVLGAFLSSSEKNSYMKLNTFGEVTEVREKIVISNIATNGLHYWKNGRDFINSATEMIEADEKYNNEFYIAPTYNYLIKEGKKVLPYFYNLHFPIGTPEDLEKYKSLYGYS